LVREYIREEAAYREALAIGLDRDDTIVRRRLRQKLEFLSDDLASRAEPTDADLQAFLQANPDLFQSEPLFSFRQIYLNPQLHGSNLQRDQVRLLVDLQRAGLRADFASFGDPFLLPQTFQSVSLAEVKRTFGDQFASAISTASLGVWQGPVASGYGAHLIFVTQRSDGHTPALADVREQVRREWLDAKRREATDKFYEALLRRYTIRIEPPEEKKVAQVH
jgi:hypothetical protein